MGFLMRLKDGLVNYEDWLRYQKETGETNIDPDFDNKVFVNRNTVMAVPSVSKAIGLISNVATLPVHLHKTTKEGGFIEVEDHRTFLLNNEPNEYDDKIGTEFKKKLIEDILLEEDWYIMMVKKGNTVTALHHIPSNSVTATPKVNKQGITTDIAYEFTYNNVTLNKTSKDIIHGKGLGIMKKHSEFLKTLIYTNEYDNYIFRNATLPSGVLETESRLTQEGMKNIKEQMERLYSGAKNFFRPLVLEQGLKFKPLSQKPSDLLLNEAKIQQARDVERMFNLPFGTLENTSNASLEGLNRKELEVFNQIVSILEETFNKYLLLEDEKVEKLEFRFDADELNRMNKVEKAEYFTKLKEAEILDIDECRFALDYEPRKSATL